MSKAVDQAYEVIREQIIARRFPPEYRLREGELAELAAVSRTPIREALRRLQAEGFVELMPNRGARVAPWDDSDLVEIYGLRAVLEGYAARLSAANASTAQADEMSRLADEMVRLLAAGRSRNEKVITALNNRFHRLVIVASQSQRLSLLWEGLVQVFFVQRTFHEYSDEAFARSLSHHQEVAEAIRSRNPQWAESVMQSHLLAAQVSVLQERDRRTARHGDARADD